MKTASILAALGSMTLVSGCLTTTEAADRNTMRIGGILCLDFRGVRLVTSDMNEKQLESISCLRTPRELPFRVVGTSTKPPALQIAIDFKSGIREYWTRLEDTHLYP